MTVDEFLAWAEGRAGGYELLDGEVVAMSPERVRHAEVKFAAQIALREAIRHGGLPCRMMPDGMTVRVNRTTAFEPDALVYCGARADLDAIEIPNPIIVVDVLSPSTRAIDSGSKLSGYFSLDSVMHYLMIDPIKRLVLHHRRGQEDLIETRIVTQGTLNMTPPGLSLSVADLFADLPPGAEDAP